MAISPADHGRRRVVGQKRPVVPPWPNLHCGISVHLVSKIFRSLLKNITFRCRLMAPPGRPQMCSKTMMLPTCRPFVAGHLWSSAHCAFRRRFWSVWCCWGSFIDPETRLCLRTRVYSWDNVDHDANKAPIQQSTSRHQSARGGGRKQKILKCYFLISRISSREAMLDVANW